jgi:hypothetical protein
VSDRAVQLREEIAALASSHVEGCECDVCLAAAGDEDALAAVEVGIAMGRYAEVDDA